MPGLRKNDPLEVTGSRKLVTDPARQQALKAAFDKRVALIERQFRFLRAHYGGPNNFNDSLRVLQSKVESGDYSPSPSLHPEVGFAVWYAVNEAAAARGNEGPPTLEDIIAGQREVVRLLNLINRRPEDRVLRFHVEALMALVQEASGRAVMATRGPASNYNPRATSPGGEFVMNTFQRIEPTIESAKIVNIILDARKEYAGKSMPFLKFFPFYGCKITPLRADGSEATEDATIIC